MKYSDHCTFKGKQSKKHGHTTKPAYIRYFNSCRWILNKAKNIAKQAKKEEK